MYPPIFITLNQQISAGHHCGNQGVLAEMRGDYAGAANSYDQAIAWIGQSILTARQFMVPVPDHIHYFLSLAHFSAARAKMLTGAAPAAGMHLNQALMAINMAAASNPNNVQYHIARGTVLMTQGKLDEAEAAFDLALRLNPKEPWSQYMLAVLNAARGNIALANSYYTAVRAVAPQLPEPQTMTPPGAFAGLSSGSGANQGDWANTIIQCSKALQSVFQTVNTFNSMMSSWQ